MPNKSRFAVDSHPRLSGVMDTVNSTLAHGPETRLPTEFYDKRAIAIIDKIGVEEWFAGFKESNEYRTVAIGSLAGDILSRMVGNADRTRHDGLPEKEGERSFLDKTRTGEPALRFALSGCHDTTLAALLSSLGAFDDRSWPPYTSHIAFELFKAKEYKSRAGAPPTDQNSVDKSPADIGWFEKLFSSPPKKATPVSGTTSSRKRLEDMTTLEKGTLQGYFVRVRYNDEPVTIPRCRLPGNHLEGDETFCTLVRPIKITLDFKLMNMLSRRHSKPL